MARGAAPFDHRALRELRRSTAVYGHQLSAAELARRLGTSKARVLAYEGGTSVPEAGRIAELAEVFGVPTKALYRMPPRLEDGIRHLRFSAGLTMAELATRLGISGAAYRDLEHYALLPARNDGTLPLRLARELCVSLREIETALNRHPHATERRRKITQMLEPLFLRAHVRNAPAVVDVDEPALLNIARLLRRPPGVVSRLVNYELSRLRGWLRMRAEAEVRVAYAQNEREASRAQKRIAATTRYIDRAAQRAAATLVRFLAEAMSSRQWRTVVHLVNREVTVPESRARELADPEAWDGLVARRFVTHERSSDSGPGAYSLSAQGLDRILAQAQLYACLYPRASTPHAHLAHMQRHRLSRRATVRRMEAASTPSDSSA
ncbi:helix-turn-helix transcriptional regulator [Streptomyces sp. NPDC050617]|uniref:helix-turn-helix transcriptional regulator n=1 Tax=Streptomyces sp. NPDC050617 TaxID=3154628 RepID=UPI0034135593